MRVGKASADWIGRGWVRIPPGLILSFQRFARPVAGAIDRAFTSLGALPAGLDASRELVLPLAEDECFWIGLDRTSASPLMLLSVAVELQSGEVLDAISGRMWEIERPATVNVPDAQRIAGIRRPDGLLWPFARETRYEADLRCARLRFRIAAAPAINRREPGIARNRRVREFLLRLVDYGTFAAESGQAPPDPLDADSGYKGWLLP